MRLGPRQQGVGLSSRLTDRRDMVAKGHTKEVALAFGVEKDIASLGWRGSNAPHDHGQHGFVMEVDIAGAAECNGLIENNRGIGTVQRRIEMQLQATGINPRNISIRSRHKVVLIACFAGAQITKALLKMKQPINTPIPLTAIKKHGA